MPVNLSELFDTDGAASPGVPLRGTVKWLTYDVHALARSQAGGRWRFFNQEVGGSAPIRTFKNAVVWRLLLDSSCYTISATPRRETPAEQFARLADEWRQERSPVCSSISAIVSHPAYQQIIKMGEAAIPYILAELERELDDWFWALHSISGADPVATEDRGRMQAMADAWLRWGRIHSYIQ